MDESNEMSRMWDPEPDVERGTTSRRRRRGTYWAVAVAVVVVLIAATVAIRPWDGSDGGVSAAARSTTTTSNSLQNAFVNVVNRARPSIVEIQTSEGLGSGVVYDNKGDIVTNAHVVAGANKFQVTLAGGKTLDATLVGKFTPDDLAVVKVAAGSAAPATFADSSKINVGDIVLALGNPLGLASSVTEGIVSATGRTVSEGGGVVLPSTIQTSAAINPGNSGGGLVDINGAVIGIPTLAATDPQLGGGSAPGIGFAIPSNTVKMIADQLIASGKVTSSGRASLGISASDVMTSTGQGSGTLVRSATAGGPAAIAGIKGGDIITSVDGTPTPTLADLQAVLAGLAPDKSVAVKVTHSDGSKETVNVTLGEL